MGEQTQSKLRENTADGSRGNPETRIELLDAALRIFEHKSIFDVTVDDFVQEARVARGTFYIYFSDKYDILAALTDRHHEELFSSAHITIDRRVRAFDRLRQSLRRVVESWMKYAGLYRSINQMALARSEFLRIDQENRFRYIDRIREDIDSSIERNRARPIDSSVAAKALAAMMDRICLLWFALGEPPYDGADEDIDHVVDNLSLLWYRSLYGHDPEDIDVDAIVARKHANGGASA